MVTGWGEGHELPGYVVQPKKQIIQGGVCSGRKQMGFHFCSELLGSCLQTAVCFTLSPWLIRCSAQFLVCTLSCFWRSGLMPELQLRVCFPSETRKACCIMDQLRGKLCKSKQSLSGAIKKSLIYYSSPSPSISVLLLITVTRGYSFCQRKPWA